MAKRVYGYQGYGAYQFETSPKKVQPKYEPDVDAPNEGQSNPKELTRKKKVVQNEKKQKKISKEELNRRVKFFSYILFGFVVLFSISYRNSIINEKFSKKEELKTNLAEIKKINEQLDVGIENELNLTSVEQLAKEKLGMGKLSNSQKVYITLPKQEYVESKNDSLVLTEKNEDSNILETIKQLFNIK